jgi:hypothetical protein
MTPEWLSEFLAVHSPRAGALSAHLATFAAALADQGYATMTTKEQIRLAAEFGRWSENKRALVSDLGERHTAAFLAARRRSGRRERSHAATLRALLGILRDVGVVRPASCGHGL